MLLMMMRRGSSGTYYIRCIAKHFMFLLAQPLTRIMVTIITCSMVTIMIATMVD